MQLRSNTEKSARYYTQEYEVPFSPLFAKIKAFCPIEVISIAISDIAEVIQVLVHRDLNIVLKEIWELSFKKKFVQILL
jgi:hypothetical protein